MVGQTPFLSPLMIVLLCSGGVIAALIAWEVTLALAARGMTPSQRHLQKLAKSRRLIGFAKFTIALFVFLSVWALVNLIQILGFGVDKSLSYWAMSSVFDLGMVFYCIYLLRTLKARYTEASSLAPPT